MSGVHLRNATEIKVVRDQLIRKQGNKCLLCDVDFREQIVKNGKRKSKAMPTLDHCHETGFIRGVLCNTCNGRLGEGKVRQAAKSCSRMLTEAEWLTRLAAYWTLHIEPQTQWIHREHKTPDEKRIARNKKERIRRATAKARKQMENK